MIHETPELANDISSENRALWVKLAHFSFCPDSNSSVAKSFSARLAVENGWTMGFTERVLHEYRRFLFLTAVAGHTVCPSEEVDAAWHQHLIYSRSYWNDLCQETLGYPLHHDPTSGGPSEARKHWELYQKTLASYRRIFGEAPPQDIWPLPFERFDPHSRSRVVNVRDHWVFLKPTWWPRRVPRKVSLLAALPLIPAVGLGPLDLPGPQFLVLFFSLYLVFFIGSIIYCQIQRNVSVTDDQDLSPEEVACLKFGRPAAVNATVARMLHDHQLISVPCKGFFGQNVGSKVKFAQGQAIPSKGDEFARAISMAVNGDNKTLVQIQKSLDSESRAIDDTLREKGYLLDAGRLMMARIVPGILMMVLLGLGITKVMIGIERQRPVLFLVMGCFVAFGSFTILMLSLRRTRAGAQMLKSLESTHRDLKQVANDPNFPAEKVALSAALFGASGLVGPQFEDLKSAWKSTAQSGTMTGSGCAGGSGCGGGGGGGGGGCGGGGCGGCGGG